MRRLATKSPPRPRRQLADVPVLRYVPGESPLHRLWAGTKMLAVASLSLGLVLWPSWGAAGIAAAVVLTGFLLARLPMGVAPRIPRFIWFFVVVGLFLTISSGGKPVVHLGSTGIGLGGLEAWVRFSLIGIEVLALAALVAWTTPLADLAPAIGRLSSPLRALRLPVDEVVAAAALGIRCLPLLVEEVRVLGAARRTRHPERLQGFQQRAEALEELLYAAVASTLRRARELADAIEARGGVAVTPPETHSLDIGDWLALLTSAVAFAAMALVR